MCPRIFHIYGDLWINGYGLMIAIGLLLFTYLTYNHSLRKDLISGENFLNILFIGFVSGVVGGRLLFVFLNFEKFNSFLEIFYLWTGGFYLLGTIIAVIICVPLYLNSIGVRFLPFMDLVSIYAPLLQAISRIGCFLAGCCFGASAGPGIPWAVTFTDPESFAPIGVPLHPTQLYSAAASFTIFLILRSLTKRLDFKSGVIFSLYLIFESMARFSVDFWRGAGDRDLVSNFLLGPVSGYLSSSQIIAVFLFFLAIIFLASRIKSKTI